MAARETGSSEQVRSALRLGWAIAEFRGRLRLDRDALLAPATAELPAGTMPLSNERLPEDLRTEAQRVLAALADSCGIPAEATAVAAPSAAALPAPGPAESPPPPLPAPAAGESMATYLGRLGEAATAAGASGRVAETAWEAVDAGFRDLDAAIQDELATGPFGRASAYQLGRGLAETFWALQPAAAPTYLRDWSFVLSERRRASLSMLIDRLSYSMQPYAADAVKSSLDRWSATAAQLTRRPDDAVRGALFRQTLIWRDLLLTGTDPLNLLKSKQGVIRARRVLPVLSGFIPELTILAVAIVALGLGGVLFVVGGLRLAALSGVIGAFGVVAAAILARVKSVAQDLGDQMRRAIYRDLVATAAYIPPPEGAPGVPERSRRPALMAAALRRGRRA